MDKTKLGPGPWQDEPDGVEFEHAGLPCLMKRNRYGIWCGYAAVPPGHPLHGQGIYDIYDNISDVRVHGGVTYASACEGEICHVPKPGEPDDVWWIGFDCGHCDDLSPLTEAMFPDLRTGGTYRDHDYVQAEVRGLAEQLAGMDRARD